MSAFQLSPKAGARCVEASILLPYIVLVAACGGGGGSSQGPSGGGPPPTVTISANPTQVDPGGTTVVTWSSQNANSCTASGDWAGAKATSGSETLGPLNAAASFGLSCSGASGSAQATTSVSVIFPEPVVSLTVSPSAVRSGESATLEWSATNANSCTASGGWTGSRPASGRESSASITGETTFNLTCSGQGGQQSATAVVKVNAVSGALLVQTISVADGDVNDPFSPFLPNGTAATAQQLPNPAIVGGFVNEPSKGPGGRSYEDGDLEDIFKIRLVENQLIELLIPSADPALSDDLRDDADLYLFDYSGNLVDASLGIGQVEQIVVPSSGDYFILVYAWSGAPLYRLSVGKSLLLQSVSTLKLSDEFIPNQLIVRESRPTSQLQVSQGARQLAESRGLRLKAGSGTREMLFSIPARNRQAGQFKPSHSINLETGLRVPPRLAEKLHTLHWVKSLQGESPTSLVAPNRVLRHQAIPNDPLYGAQRWHYEMIQLAPARDLIQPNGEVIVAVVDTGVVPHPDLIDNLLPGYDFISSPTNADGGGLDSDPDDPGCPSGLSTSFHGTHVAGTVSATTNNSLGVSGVAGNVAIMPIRVLDGCTNSGTVYDIAQGIRFSAGLSNDSGQLPARRADVINLSLGGLGACDTFASALFAEVRAQGVSVVAAAGNENTSQDFYPASCPDVIAVSAVGPTRTRAPYSNFNSLWIDVAAPGGDMGVDRNGDGSPDGVYSTSATGGGAERFATYSFLQGTSMAAPHVAGVIGMLKAAAPSLTPSAIDGLLAQGQLTDDIGSTGPDELGVGLVNAQKAVLAASGGTVDIPAQLVITPSSINFGDVSAVSELRVSNGGTQSMAVTNWTASDSWIAVGPADSDAQGLGRYQVQIGREGLESGVYSGWVDFFSTAGQKRVEILMQVTDVAVTPSAGFQYILLLDKETFEPIEQVEVAANSSEVSYLFDKVSTGEYYIAAGTDMNNDGYICEDGEACGFYPIFSDPTAITVSGPSTGLNIPTSFRTGLQQSAASLTQPKETGRRMGYRLIAKP